MRIWVAALVLLSLASCLEPREKTTFTENLGKPRIDTALLDSMTRLRADSIAKTLAKAPVADTIAGKPVQVFLDDPKIGQGMKDLYSGGMLRDDSSGLGLIDSLASRDTTRLPFYFLALTRFMPKADGAVAEPLGIAAKTFAETRSPLLAAYLGREKSLTDRDRQAWVGTVAGEICIDSEGKEFIAANRFRRKMLAACPDCTPDQKAWLEAFASTVQDETKKCSGKK